MPEENLKQKILKETEKTGFPLELRVSKFLIDNGYIVANNLYYIDQDESKGREVDMRALKNFVFRSGEREFYVRNCLLIECKRSVDKPWVVFTSSQTFYDKALFMLQTRGFKKDANWKTEAVTRKVEKIHPFAIYERRGRSFFEPFKETKGGEMIFKSLTTAVKVTIATRNNEFAAKGGSICFYYPLVIFDGNLYEAYLKNDNVCTNKNMDFL